MSRQASKRWQATLWTLVLAFGLNLSPAAQGTASGSILGTVTDSSGAVVPGATVTAKSLDTGLTRINVTDSRGLYRILLLPVGNYEVSVEQPGFTVARRSPMQLTVGQSLEINFALTVAGTQQTVEVSTETSVVETSRTEVSATVNDRAVANLPVNGRNFIDFVLLTPGVTRDVRTGDISFGGQRGTLNSLQIDGADNNNTFFGQALGRTGSGRAPYQFSQDAVREFQVNANGYSAEYGRAGGAVVNVVTKSGTNDFHGTGFWFYRDKSLNANTFFNNANNRPKAPYHINQFGGNIGGPIARDRAFFFFDYDGQRQQINNDVILGGQRPYPTDPDSQAGLAKLDAKSQDYIRAFNQDVYLAKTDFQLGNANRLSVRYNHQDFLGQNLENSGQTSAVEHTGNSLVKTDTLTASLSSILNPRLLNEVRFQWARDKEPGEANATAPEAEVRQGGQVVLTIGRNNFSPRETTVNRYQVVNNLSWMVGRHDFKFGVDLNFDGIKNYFPGQFGGQYFFSSLAQFNRGVPDRYVQAFAGQGTSGALTHPDSTDVAFFFQDNFRATPKLLLSFGMRYDLQLLATPEVLNPSSQLQQAGIATNQVNRDTNNVAPRFGFAWKPTGSDRLVIRGGYGIFLGRTPAIMLAQSHSQNGVNVLNLTFTGSAVPTYPNVYAAPPASGGTAATPSLYVFQPQFVNPYVQQGSLGVEFGLGREAAVTASYLMVKGTHLQRTRDVNLFAPVAATINVSTGGTLSYLRFPGSGSTQTRPLNSFQRISQFESSADSAYHGLAVQLNKRYSRNFQTLFAYTLSKVIDTVPDATSVVAGNAGDDAKMIQDPKNIRNDRALGVTDQRHKLTISGIWDLAYFNELENPVVKALVSGWSLSGIFNYGSGRPYSGLIGSDLNNDGNRSTDRVPGEGRNIYTGFNFISLDPRVTREFRLHEDFKLQFIFEAFNLFNRANFTAINNTKMALSGNQLVPQSNFGTARDSSDPRILQLALKLLF